MAKNSSKRIAFVGSFPPRKCGIATFTSDLVKGVSAAGVNKFEPLVVAMSNDKFTYAKPVEFEIRSNSKNDYICAADYINFSNVQVISVQHEFGIFGGEAGSYLNLFLHKVNAPIITTLHTVIEEPSPDYYSSMMDLCQASRKLIIMNVHGITTLTDVYGVDKDKIELIPHGIPDLPFVDSSYYKHNFGFENRKTILTFGLIGRSKGIEVMLKAMPEIIKADPSVLYIVLGATHPEVLKFEGESYRFELQRMVKDLGIQSNVVFYNRFVTDQELNDFLCAADIYVTPYLSKEQLTSGTLAFAVGAGKTVVSSPYWAAQELLAKGRGKLVPFGNSKALAEAITQIINDPSLFHSMRRQAYNYGRSITWQKVGQLYWKLFNSKNLSLFISSKPEPVAEPTLILELPEPPLEHLKRLTDDTGLFQHANFIIPDRSNGYCTDDNARAALVMLKYYQLYAEPEALRLFEIYLSFICHAQKSDGTVRNFMDFNRNWRINEPASDALGRALWAFGAAVANPPSPNYLSTLKYCFDISAPLIPKLSLHQKAYAIFGLADYLKQFPGASEIKRLLTIAADSLVAAYEKTFSADWHWFENILAYDNAIFPEALFVAAMSLSEKKYLKIAERTCDFLLETIYNGKHFSFIGNNGWYVKGRSKAMFDQQPIEAASTVTMLAAAFGATCNRKYLHLQRKAFDWYLGENDLHTAVYNFRTKGCCDALGAGGVNINQGAESMISFLLAILAVIESHSKMEKPTVDTSANTSNKPKINIISTVLDGEKIELTAEKPL